MVKDRLNRYCPVRSAGTVISKKVEDDVWVVLDYIRSECADFLVNLEVEKSYWVLFDFRLSFCLACGRFTHFGTFYEICWECEDMLE